MEDDVKIAPYGTDAFVPSSKSCDTKTRTNIKNPARTNLDTVL